MDEKQKPLYELYTELPESGYQVAETYEEFEKAFTTDPDAEKNRHTLFEELKDKGLGPENYETFYSTLFQPKDAKTSVAIDPNTTKPSTQSQTKQVDQTATGTPTNVASGTGSAAGTTDKVAAAKDANKSQLDSRPSITSVLDNVANDVKQAVTTSTDPQLNQSAQSASMQHGQSPTVVNQQEKSRGYNVWKTKISNAFDDYALGKIDDKQFKSTIDNVGKDIESGTDNQDERNEFNTFIKDLQKRAQNTRSTKSVQVKAGYEAFPNNSDSVVWDFKLSRKQLPHQQDYVRTLRNMVTGGQSFNVMYNVTDPEIQRDYQIVSDPKAESTYKPNDYILGESKAQKDKDYQLYAAYLYLNGGDLPDWLDYTAQNKIKALSKQELETKANQWKSLVDGTRTKRKYKGLNSIADYYASQNTFSTGEARATYGNRFATIVLPNGTYQTVDIHGVKGDQASVGDARKAFNARFNSTETADESGNGNAQAPKGDTYLMPTIFNEERYSNSFPEWDDLDDKTKAQFDNSVFKYWDEMNKRQAISVPVFVENGKSVDKAEDEFNAKNAKTQFAQLTKREEIESQIKQAKKLRKLLETAFENLRQSAKEERNGGVSTMLGDAGQFRVAFRNIDNFIEAGERAIKDRHYSAFTSFWENLSDAGGWSLGLTNLNEALGLNHLASGEGVSPEIEKAFGGKKGVKEFAAAVQYFGQKAEQWRQKLGYYDEAGKAGLIQFMGTSMLPTFKVATLAGNAAKGVVKFLGKYAVKALDKGVAETASASIRAVSQSAINRSLKTALKEGGMAAATRYGAAKSLNVGVNAAALVAQGFTDGTILSVPEVFTNVANRRTGNAQVAEITREGIKFGDELFVHDNQNSERDVIKETLQRGQAEWMGMRLGEIFGPWSRYLDQHMMSWGKTAYKKTLGKFLDGSNLEKTLGMIAKGAKATDVYKYVTNRLEQAGMGGSLTFYTQNNLSQLINALTVGDVSVSEALSGKKGNNISWADMTWGQIQKAWGAVIDNAIVCGVHTTIGAASYKKQCLDLTRLQRKNEKECTRVLDEEYWAKLKHDIDLCGETSDKALIAYTRAIRDNADLSGEAKQAIINYALTLKTQQALNYGALNNGKTNALDLRYQDAYDAGADVKSPDEISKLQENANSARVSLAKLLGCSTDEVDSKVKGFGEGYREIYEAATKDIADEQKKKEVQNVLDVYFTNLAAVEGAHDALIVDHEQKLEQNKSYVEQNSNKESGTTIQATDKDGRIWYVISGDPRRTNSSDMLIVRDGVTGEIGHGSVSEFEFASEQNTQDLVNEGNKSISEEYLSKRNAILKGETLPERGDKVSVLDANGKVIEVTVEGIEQSETDGTPTGITVRTEDGQMYNFTTDEYRNAVKGVAERETATYIGNDNFALNRAISSSQVATGTEFVHDGKRYTFDHIDDNGNWVARPVGQEGHSVEFSEEEVRTGIDDLLAGKVQGSEQSEANNDEEIKVGTEFTFEDGTPGVVTGIRDDGTFFIASKDSPVSFDASRERVTELIAKSHNAERATDASGESPKTQDTTKTAADDKKEQTAADISVGDKITINGHIYKVEGIDGNRCAIEKDGRRYIWRVSDIEKGIEDGRVKINAETESTDAAEKSSETDIAPAERIEDESAIGLSEANKIPEGEATSSDQETGKLETPHTDVEESSAEVKPQPQEGQAIVTDENPKETPTTEAPLDHHAPALNRIPKDEKGEPMFEKAPLDQSYDALLEQTGGSAETTSEVIKEMVEDKRKALADAEAEEIPHANGAMAKIAARKAHDEKVKQARQELEYWEDLARVPEERARAEEEPQPIGKGFFGNIYDQFKGKVKAALDFLLKHREGDLLGVFHRDDLGDIDLVWGNRAENRGLDHIIDKHIERYHDFANAEEAMRIIDDVINNGQVNEKKSRWDKVVLDKDGYSVVIRKNLRDDKGNIIENSKNWVVTAFDNNRTEKEKSSPDITIATPNTDEGSRAVAPGEDSSAYKGTIEHTTGKTSSTEKAETDNKNSVSDQISEVSTGVDAEFTGSKKGNARKTDGEPHAHPEQPLTERTRQACESVAKSLGIDVEWVDHMPENGSYAPHGKNGRPVICIARDAENPLSTVFGHEGTHAVRSISEDAYKSLVDKARAVVGDEEWNKRFKATKELYEGEHLTDDQIAEEVVADIVGEMITDRDMAEKLAYRLDHPTLSALRDVARKMWETVKRFVGGNKLTAYEQAVKDFADTIERAFADAKEASESLSESTRTEMAENSLGISGGAVMSDYARGIKNRTGYQTPNERGEFADDSEKHSKRTLPFTIVYYKSLANARQSTANALENWSMRRAIQDEVNEIIDGFEDKMEGRDKTSLGNSPVRKQADIYGFSFDVDTSCPRSFVNLACVEEAERRLGRPLTLKESVQLNEHLRAYGLQIPCVYCYVENKRQALKDSIHTFMAARNGVYNAKSERERRKLMYGQRKPTAKDPSTLTKAAQTRLAEWSQRKDAGDDYNPSLPELYSQYNNARSYVLLMLGSLNERGDISETNSANALAKVVTERLAQYADLHDADKSFVKGEITSICEDWIYDKVHKEEHTHFSEDAAYDCDTRNIFRPLSLWNEATKYAKSSSSAKKVSKYMPYTDELRYLTPEQIDALNSIGGLRFHSNNDFRIDYVEDYFQVLAHMSAIGLMGQAYTKSPDFVRIFGGTGLRVNMSIAAYGGENGKPIIMNEQEGFNWKVAQELREKYPDAGVMMMVTNDAQLEYALNCPWIDMVIPFHASGLPRAVWYNMRQWQNYTAKQNEKLINAADKKKALKAKGIDFKKETEGMSKDKASAWLNDTYDKTFGTKHVYGIKEGKRVLVCPHFEPGDKVIENETGRYEIPGHHNDLQTYLQLCEEYGVKPRFAGIKVRDANGKLIDVTEHPNYMKLIKETARTEMEQHPVEFNIDQADERMPLITEDNAHIIFGNNYDKAEIGKHMSPMQYAMTQMFDFAKKGGYTDVKDYKTLSESTGYGDIVGDFIDNVVKKNRPINYLTDDAHLMASITNKALTEAYGGRMPYEGKRKADVRHSRRSKVTPEERAIRDELANTMKNAGIDVSVDDEEGQRVMDDAREMDDVRLSAKRKRALETAYVSQSEEHQPTVVSSADGAKVLKDIDIIVSKYEKHSNQTKTFIGDVATALGATRDGSKSEYATFETKNGKIVTIRLADHNATVSNFDNRGELDGISIVITPKTNEGITNDGDAHVVEHFYDSIKLRRADGKPLAEIVKSIKQSLYSGEFKDTTGLAERQEVNADTIREQRVYHGSGADFDHFDHSHMGEGEGAQVYGWGTYVTEVEGIGRTYARASNQSTLRKEKLKSDISRAKERLPFMKGEYKTALEKEIAQKEEELSKMSDANHHLYTVEIPDDNGNNYLDWTKEYSEDDVYSIIERLLDVAATKAKEGNLDEREKLRGAADRIAEWVDGDLKNDFFDKLTGENIYRKVAGSFEDYSEEEASKLLSEAGFAGIKYPAENMSGGRADGAKDYVIFNEADAQITDHIRFFRTPNGEAYGFTKGGKIYIDPRIAKADTPIHEYTHLWATALRQGNPKEWANVVNLMKGEKELWDDVKKRYPELKADDEIADEVLAHYSGKRGAERLRKEQRKIAEGEGSIFEKARAIRALEKVKQALDKFWKGVADFLHIHYTSAEEVADRVMSDLLNGVNPTKNTIREQRVYHGSQADFDSKVLNKLEGRGTLQSEETDVTDLPKDMAYRETDINELADILKSGGMRRMPNGKVVEHTPKPGRISLRPKLGGNSHGGKGFAKGAPWSSLGGTLSGGSATKVLIGVPGKSIEWQTGHHGSYTEAKPFEDIKHGEPLFLKFDENGNVPVSVSNMRIWVVDKGGNYHEFIQDSNSDAKITDGNGGEKRTDEQDDNLLYRTSDELNSEYGDRWISEQTNEDGRHTTQVKNTINSYKKFGEWVKADSNGRDVSILDASSGLGLGTDWMRENGMNVDDVEPYPSEDRTKPTFTSYDDIDKRYDYIVSNAVLNVIPDDWRANVLHNMADKLKDGGKMVINVRGANSIAKQGKEGVTRITLDDPSEILVLRPDGSIKAYQKGFTKEELKDWCKKELGDGYSVEIATNKNAGGSYDTAVVVTKNNESGTIGVTSEAGHPRGSAQTVPNSYAKLDNGLEITKGLDNIVSQITQNGKMGAHEFLYNLSSSFGFKGKNLKESYYKDLSENIGIRIANHYANADNFAKKGSNEDNYGIVIKLSPNKFKDKDGVNYLEYVYFPDKLSGERQTEIVNGLKTFLQTGDYAALPHPDKVNASGRFKEELLLQNPESPEAKTAAVNTLSKEMNLQGNVTVLTSTEGLTGKKASAPGWCDPKTGHITIVLPNNADAADVQKTVFHEAVGHHGLRRLVGDGNFNDFLDNVYNNAEQGITQTIDQLAKEKHQGDRRKATEEYMSTLAEDESFLNAGNRSLFQKVKQLFTDLLRKAGINLGTELTDNDLRYILWKSYKNLTDNGNPDVFAQAEDIAKQNHLKVGDYAKHETAAEREINNADNERGLLFRTPSAPNNDPMNVASSYYNQKAETLGTKTLFGGLWAAMRHPKENGHKFLNEASESFFDYSRSVKALQDGIAEALGRPIRDDEDAWRTMNSLPAVNQEQLNAVQNNLVAPLGEHIGNIIKNTKDKPGGARTMDDVEIYLNCKHGLERNKAMAERNAEEVMDKAKKNLANMMDKAYAEKLRIMASGDQQAISDYNKKVSHIKSRMGQGKRIDDSEYAKVAADQLGTFADRKDLLIVIGQTADAYIDALRDQYIEAQCKDYSGLTEIFHPDYKEQRAQGVTYDVNNLEDEARNLIAQFEGAVGKADIDELWKLVGNLTDFALRKSYVSGNISLQQYQDTKAMYANYVPLRGWNSKNADDVYNYVAGSSGLTPEDFQKVMKKAYGRESRAGYIFGTMIDMATTAVSQGNRNVMKQCLLNLAERSQTNLLRAGEVVYEQSSNGTLTSVLPKLHDGMTEQEIADAYSDWQDDVKNGLANGTYIRINSKLKTGLHAPQWEEDQHQIVVNRNGKKYIVYVNGNPRAAQAVNGLLDFTSDYNAVEKQLLRHFAAVQTSFSPEFVVSNAQRDLATAAASGFIKEGAGYTKDFVANYFKIMPGGSLLNGDAKTGTERVVGIYDLIRRYDRNELDLTNDTDRYYYEFCTNGGKTGITNLRRIEDYQEQVDKMTREVQNKYGTMPRRAVKGILDAIEYINAGVENATRFATYMTSRQRGKSVKQSIHDAKECSVNFNAHGSGAWMDSFFRKHYNYANAVFQSLRMNKEWMKSNPQRYTGVVAGALAMGMLSALLGTAICGGNDDDENGYYGLSEWNRYRFFNIPVAKHGFLHYALPQEFRGMFGTGVSIVDLINGKITTDHFVKTLMSNINDFSVVPFYDDDAYNLASGDMSIPGMLVKGFIPTIVAPITDAYLYNRDFLGRPITNATSNNKQAPEWQRAGKDTPQVMIDASKWLNEHTGGQPNRRGGLENATGAMLNPSAIWYIIEQVGGGTMTFATKMKKTFEAMLTGDTSELKENDIPFAGKFYVSSSDDNSKQRTINEQYNGITQDFKNLDYELRKNWRGKNITDGEFNQRMRQLMDEGQVELWDSIVGNEHAIKTMQRAIHKNPDNEELKKELDSLIYQNKVEIVHKYEAWKKKYHK